MKHGFRSALAAFLCAVIMIQFVSCYVRTDPQTATETGEDSPGTGIETEKETDKVTETVTETFPPDITEKTDHTTQTWVAVDIDFETDKTYGEGEQLYVFTDVIFTHRESGKKLTIPAFWYGGKTFTVRFAPTEYGVWDFVTSCGSDASLDGKTGTVAANAYKGKLEIYRRGFVKTNGSKHFVYDDGTPFFYLGDTHWSMLTEEFDRAGLGAARTGARSHFKYIVDKRVEQGFTVYESEPIGTKADLTDGSLSSADAAAFNDNDRYYRYIAEKGLVHANAEFFFAGSMNERVMNDEKYLEAISRYWVARYSAYPVMWTLGQEIDNDFYRERGDQKIYDYSNNPWVKIAEYLHKYDAYGHPLSGHQENAIYTTVTGRGTTVKETDNGGRSAFYADNVTERTGHDWWAVQWQPELSSQINDAVPKDYYESGKVAINYESRYCNLWTKDYGARAQSWIAMLSGFAGVGYGAADIWLYNSTYNMDEPSNDGLETVTVADKAMVWGRSVELESAYQQGYMRKFFEGFNWWELTPDFNDGNRFDGKVSSRKRSYYVCASIGNDLYVVYLYSKNNASGTVCGMDGDAVYEAEWFDPRTGEYTVIGDIKADKTDKNGAPAWSAPDRPESLDFVLVLRKK